MKRKSESKPANTNNHDFRRAAALNELYRKREAERIKAEREKAALKTTEVVPGRDG